MPRATVIPVLLYPDVTEAAEWLCRVFQFSVRLRIGDHRVQLNVGDDALVVAKSSSHLGDRTASVMVRVEDIDAHYRRVLAEGGEVTAEPATHPYGERQYSVEDFAGQNWTFSQSVADVDPAAWGGVAS